MLTPCQLIYVPEDGAESGQLVELLPADMERREDLDVAAKLAHRVHQTHKPLPLRNVLKHAIIEISKVHYQIVFRTINTGHAFVCKVSLHLPK